MKGTRPLTTHEVIAVQNAFSGTYAIRDQALFLLGISTGARISELLSLQIGDVSQRGHIVSDLTFAKSIVKGKTHSRTVPLSSKARSALTELITYHTDRYNTKAPSRPLFPSRNNKGNRPLTRRAAHNILKRAFNAANLTGHLATHTLRKTFAQHLYNTTNDIVTVQILLGHQDIAVTQRYLGIDYQKTRDSVESMFGRLEVPKISKTGSSARKNAETDAILLELARRGYDLSRLRTVDETEAPTGEIVKIKTA